MHFFKNLYLSKFNIIFFVILFILNTSNSSAQNQICDSYIIDNISKNIAKKYHQPIFHYNEDRNDAGIIFDFKWDISKKKTIIKRNKNNYPIVRFSLFEKEKIIPNTTAIKLINDKNLSKLSDSQIEELSKLSGEIKITLDDENETIYINSKRYKLNDFKLTNFEIQSINNIDTTKGILEISFLSNITNVRNDLFNLLDKENHEFDGYHAICPEFRSTLNWPVVEVGFDEFRYDADVREGLKNKEILVNSVFDLINDNNEIRTFRTEKGVASFRQSFDFKKFPFDKQKLIIRIKPNIGSWSNWNDDTGEGVGSVTMISPEPRSFFNLEKFIDPKINKLKAWKINDDGIQIVSKVLVDKNYYDIFEKKIVTKYENILDIEITIDRNFQHYLLKIMLPVFLILCVAWYVLWIPTEKYEARLNTSIIALLALIAYNFVFQDDLPKLEYLTALDWYVLLSYIFCCIPVFLSIGFSKFISTNQKKVMKINKFIKIWGGFLYLFLTLQIFYNY